MEPTNLPGQHAKPDPVVPSRVHWQHHANNDEHMPKSVWAACVGLVGDVVRHLREVGNQPDKRALAGQPDKSCESCLSCIGHYCPRHAERHCKCAGSDCADDDCGDAIGNTIAQQHRVLVPEPNKLGNFRCPITGQLCSSSVCKEWCEAGVDYTKT